MSVAGSLEWAITQARFSEEPAALPDGGSVRLVPFERLLVNRAQAERVARKHTLRAGCLVPVVTTPDGRTFNKWNHAQEGNKA